MRYDLLAAQLAIILVVGVVLELVSRWKGLARDEFHRCFFAGLGSLISAISVLFLGVVDTVFFGLIGMAFFFLLIAWNVKRIAEKDTREAVAD